MIRRMLVGCLAITLLGSACSLGPREVWAEAIRDGFETARAMGGARVLQTVAVKVIETNIRQTPRPLISKSTGVVDFDERQARMVESAKRKSRVIYDDLVVYLSRSRSSVAGQPGVSAEGATGKHWARFDFEREPSVDIDDNDRRLAVGVGLISPALAVEFLEGVLTGSIEEVGKTQRGGAQATRYTARLAPDAVVNETRDEDRQEGITRLFATYGVQQDDFPVDVWLDEKDQVRGVRFVMRQQKDRVNAFELKVSWVFSNYGIRTNIKLPSPDDVVRSPRFRDFVEELIREF